MSTIDFTWRPIDPMYFGPPVSLTAGDVHGGTSLFPPPPMTFQGIVRTRLLAGANPPLDLDDWSRAATEERARLVGSPERLPAGWQLTGPFPARLAPDIEPWFPTPRFVLHRDGIRFLARIIDSPQPGCDDLHPDPDAEGGRWEVGAPESEDALGGWVSAGNLWVLLGGRGAWDPLGFGRRLPPFVRSEHRTGVAIDADTGSARDGLLYSLSAVRLAPSSGFLGRLVASLPEQLSASSLTSGLGFGGRGARPIHFGGASPMSSKWRDLRAGAHLRQEIANHTLLWLVAIAPARLANSGSPITAPMPNGVTCTVRAAFMGPPLVLGGQSIVTGDSRANRVFAPAGSAWLIELGGGTEGMRWQAVETLHDRPSIGDSNDHCFGFGHTLVGRYQRHEEAA